MSSSPPQYRHEKYGFYLVPGFSALGFVSAMEPLRVANRLAGRTIYSWTLHSADGAPVQASCGLTFGVDGPLDEDAATLILCAGFEPRRGITPRLTAALRRMERRGAVFGALDTGAYLLAAAGLIGQTPVTLHWEAVPAFREDYPLVRVTEELFRIDDRLFTCAGGTASIDLMLDLVARGQGLGLARAVSEQFIHNRIRERGERQRLALSARLGTENPHLLAIVTMMESAIEQPMSLEALARAVGITRRQMERLFVAHFGIGPAAHYRALRLERARTLLRETAMPLVDVAVATGFGSKATLARGYNAAFGHAPGAERRRPGRASLRGPALAAAAPHG